MKEKPIVKIEDKNIIRFPQQFIEENNLYDGDMFEIDYRDGGFILTPIVIFPDEYIKELEEIAKEVERGEVVELSEVDWGLTKGIQYYMSLPYKINIYKEDICYTVEVPELQGCLSSGSTIEEAISNLYDAKENWFLAAIEDGYCIPEPEISVMKED